MLLQLHRQKDGMAEAVRSSEEEGPQCSFAELGRAHMATTTATTTAPHLLAALVNSTGFSGTKPEDLHNQYGAIFSTGNRNAASHKWATFLFDNAGNMNIADFDAVSHGYCSISGSPVTPMGGAQANLYKVALKKVGGGTETGYVRHCCWPCICDLQDLVRVDTKTVAAKDGSHSRKWLVINDPCGGSCTMPNEAPEVTCSGGSLAGATKSDGGKVIIGPFFGSGSGAHDATEPELVAHCKERAEDGWQGGMGEIFRDVASCVPF